MRSSHKECLLVLIVGIGSCGASATAAGDSFVPVGSLSGFLWEDGGWVPPLVVGDELHMVGIFEGDALHFVLPWEPDSYVYTFWVRGLTASYERVSGDSRSVSYDGPGKLGIYRELRPGNHSYGVIPPNATSPSTFADGQLVLECDVAFADVQYNDVLGNTYTYLWDIAYVGGEFLDELLAQCGACEGWALGGLYSVGVPAGYDIAFLAQFENLLGSPVEPYGWGRVKGLYR